MHNGSVARAGQQDAGPPARSDPLACADGDGPFRGRLRERGLRALGCWCRLPLWSLVRMNFIPGKPQSHTVWSAASPGVGQEVGGEATRPAGSPRTLGDAVLPPDDPLLTPRLGRLSLSVSRPTPPPALSRAGWGWCPSAPGHCPGRSWLFGLESRPTPGQEPPLAASRPSPLPPAPPHPPVPQTPTTAKVQTPGPARAHESEGRPADAV